MLNKPLRVLHIHGDLIAGGGQTLSREWLRASDKSVIDPYVVVLSAPLTLKESFISAGVKVKVISGNRILQIIKTAYFIVQNHIDIVHTQSEPDRKVGHWAALLTRRKVIAHLHSEWVYFAKPNPSNNLISKLRSWVTYAIRKISERSVVKFIATSDLVKNEFQKYTTKPIETIEPGIAIIDVTDSIKKKYRDLLGCSDNETVIVNLSRIDPVKNLSDFVKVFSKLHDKNQVKGFIAGEGSLRSEIENEISSLTLNEDLQLLNALDDPMQLLGAADIFLATSTYESFGISVLEALGAGLVVIGYDLDVYSRYGDAVIRVPLGDNEALVRECQRVINDKSFYEKQKQLGIQAACNYDIALGAKRLSEIDEFELKCKERKKTK
ncbi:MAG: glycosyltransferase family 4 protein [Acidimicrobiia bacterium]